MAEHQQSEWIQDQRLVLSELKRLDKNIEALREDIQGLYNTELSKMQNRVTVIETQLANKATMYGLLGGLIPALLGLVYTLVKLVGK